MAKSRRPLGMGTPLQMIKQWKELRAFLGEDGALEALIIERDELWRIHIAAAQQPGAAGKDAND